MDSKESLIREKRTIEATRKNLLGPGGKLGIICKFLGSSITFHGGESDPLWEDPYNTPMDFFGNEQIMEEMPVFDPEGGGLYEVGWVFDGLSRGIHMEVKYIDHEKRLTVTYKGYEVFVEIAGDLERYNPFPEWEDEIEKLHQEAIDKRKAQKKAEKAARQEDMMQKASDFLQKIRLKWGI